MTIGNCTTGVNENIHKVYKKHAQGPLHQHDIAEAASFIDQINATSNAAKARKGAFSNASVYSKATDRDENVNGISDYGNGKLRQEFNESHKYNAFSVSPTEFYVKRNYDRYDTAPEEDLDLPHKICEVLFHELDSTKLLNPKRKKNEPTTKTTNTICGKEKKEKSPKTPQKMLKDLTDKLFSDKKGALPEYKVLLYAAMKYVIPRFEMTRVVKIVQMKNGDHVLVCDCQTFSKHKRACRHMYKVLRRNPQLNGVAVR